MLQFFMAAGFLFVIVSGIFIGAWTSGQQQRANFHSETREHRRFKTKIAIYSGLMGVLFFAAAGITWFFQK